MTEWADRHPASRPVKEPRTCNDPGRLSLGELWIALRGDPSRKLHLSHCIRWRGSQLISAVNIFHLFFLSLLLNACLCSCHVHLFKIRYIRSPHAGGTICPALCGIRACVSDRDRDVFYLRSGHIVFNDEVVNGEFVEPLLLGIQVYLRCGVLLPLDQFFDDRNMAVINMRVGNNVK